MNSSKFFLDIQLCGQTLRKCHRVSGAHAVKLKNGFGHWDIAILLWIQLNNKFYLIFLLFSEWRTGGIALPSLVSPSRHWYRPLRLETIKSLEVLDKFISLRLSPLFQKKLAMSRI